MDTDKCDYTIGLSPVIREQDQRYICDIINRTIEGDPGDTDDIDLLMSSISDFMHERPSVRGFAPIEPSDPPILTLFKPREARVLVISLDELGTRAMREEVEAFGFDGETLTPLYDDE